MGEKGQRSNGKLMSQKGSGRPWTEQMPKNDEAGVMMCQKGWATDTQTSSSAMAERPSSVICKIVYKIAFWGKPMGHQGQ